MKKVMTVMATVALAMTLSAMSFAQQDQSAPSNSQPTSDMQNGRQTSPDQQGTQPSSQSPDSSSSMQNSQGMQNAGGSSFSGTVVKAGGKYVLKTADANYQLDDQDKAKQFVGQQVKINGNLDSSTSMIHIADISPIS
ncbi:MAG TPA: DUF5818 domain-containing protein [Terriglobales bacterium]|jgi:hypothetical protein|nr:DUF5818 domain-containing protein [Terriglobales bacterium]